MDINIEMRIVIKRILYIIIYSLICSSSFADNVTIKGLAKSYEGDKLIITTYAEQISYTEKELANIIVNTDGSFKISLNIPETTISFIKIGNIRGRLFLEPGSEYDIILPNKDSIATNFYRNPFNEAVDIVIELKNSSDNELNFLINSFNNIYNDFVTANFKKLYRYRNVDSFDSLKMVIKEKYSKVSNDFFSNYIEYKLANIEQLAQLKSNKSLISTYFFDRPVLYNNPEYMYFFNQVFLRYLEMATLSKEGESLKNNINECNSYASALNFLEEPLLINVRLRELVTLKGLYEIYNNPGFDKSTIISIIELIKKILSNLAQGTKAPGFELFDSNKKLIKLSDFLGKYVYISFWNTSSIISVQELLSISNYVKKYGDKIEFVSICTDDNTERMNNVIEKYQLKWNILHYGNNPLIVSDYNVVVYPSYYFIDKEGNIVKAPAESPTGKIDVMFFNELKK